MRIFWPVKMVRFKQQRQQHRLLALVCFLSFLQLAVCRSLRSPELQFRRRDNVTSNHAALPPIFNTTAFSTNGTSNQPVNIQTKIYISPSSTTSSNLTSRQVLGERRILDCQSTTGSFHHSHCKYRSEKTASIRKWVTWCREPIPSGSPQPTFTLPAEATAMATQVTTEDTSLWAEYGTCDEDEVCVDSLYSRHHRESMRLIANCVKKSVFQDAGLWKDGWDDETDKGLAPSDDELEEGQLAPGADDSTSSSGLQVSDDGDSDANICKTQKPDSDGGRPADTSCTKQQQKQQQQQQGKLGLKSPASLFAGKYASVVVSKDANGNTPMKIQELGLKSVAKAGGSGAQASEDVGQDDENSNNVEVSRPLGVAEQERICHDCMKLKTLKPFTVDTEGLEMEVKMVSAGSAALAGVLWVALFSG